MNALTNNVYSTATHLLMDYLYQLSNIDSQQPNFFASNNFALRADSFSSIGGFDTTFPLAAGEDRFCDRWLYHGYKMVYAPEVRVHHTHELNLQRFWQQHFNYGRGAFLFRHPFSASKAVSAYITKNKFNQRYFLIGKQDYMVSVISAHLPNKIYYSENNNFGSFINWNNRQKIDNAISVNRINKIIHSRQQDAILILTNKVYLEFPNLKVTKLSSFHNSIVERESYDLYLLERKYLPNSS